MICTYPKLQSKKIKDIENLEKNMGKTILAFSCNDIKPSALSKDELTSIKKVEKQLGVYLVAIES